jgi:hypothetical protein
MTISNSDPRTGLPSGRWPTPPAVQVDPHAPYKGTNLELLRRQEKDSRHFGWMTYHSIALIVFACAWVFFDYLNPDSEITLYTCSLAVAIEGILLLGWYRGTLGGMFSPHGLFMAAAICFNAGQAIVRALGATPGDGIYALSSTITLETLLFVGFGLAAFSAGLMTKLFGEIARPICKVGATPRRQAVRNCGLTMMSVGLPFWTYHLVNTMQRVAQFGRSTGVFGFAPVTGIDRVPEILSDFFPVGIIWTLAGSHSRGGRQFAAVAMTVVIMANLGTGSRGPALMAAVAFAWLWHAVVKPIRGTHLAIGAAVVLVVVIPGIEAAREGWGPNGFSVSYLLSQYEAIDNPASKAMSEMGWSATTISHTMLLVPSVRNWDYGQSYLWALSTVLPNFAGGTHAAKTHGYLSDWLIQTLHPAYAASGGGWGYSFLAEAYANLGWLGALPLLFMQGFFLGAFWRWVYRKQDFASYALGATVLMCLLLYARGESATVTRAVAWQGALPYGMFSLLSRKRDVVRNT